MAKKEFMYKGKSLEDLQKLSLKELAQILPSASRRKINRGFTDAEKSFLRKLEKKGNNVETQCRDMLVLPSMVGKMIKIYNGKAFEPVAIIPEMIGHRFGEFSQTRARVAHSSPGIGASKSTASVAVK